MTDDGNSPPGREGKGDGVCTAEAAAASPVLPPFVLGMLAIGPCGGSAAPCGGSDTMSSSLDVAASNLWKKCVSCRRDIWRGVVA